MKALLERVPDADAVAAVYASIVGLVYSWSVLASFYMLPSWLFYLEPDEIVRIYAWTFLADFIESLFLLGLVVTLEAVRPHRDPQASGFRSRSLAFVLVIWSSAIVRLILLGSYSQVGDFTHGEAGWWVATFLIALVLAWLTRRIAAFASALQAVTERARIFLPIYLPLTLLGLAMLAWHAIL